MTDNDKMREYCLKVRKKGRIRYSIEQGLILGLIAFIIGNLFNLDEKTFAELYFSLKGLISFGILVIIGIAIYGTLMWWVNERTIKKINEFEEPIK